MKVIKVLSYDLSMYILSVDSLVHIAILFSNLYEIVKHILFQDL